TAGGWDQQKRTLKLASTTLASSAVALRADNVQLVASNEPALAGTIDFRSDLARLSEWVAPGPQGRSTQLAGQAEGRIELSYRGSALAANWVAKGENVAYFVASPPPP